MNNSIQLLNKWLTYSVLHLKIYESSSYPKIYLNKYSLNSIEIESNTYKRYELLRILFIVYFINFIAKSFFTWMISVQNRCL